MVKTSDCTVQKGENFDVETRGRSVTQANCKDWHVVLNYHLTAMDFSDFFYVIRIRGTGNIVLAMTCIACICSIRRNVFRGGSIEPCLPPFDSICLLVKNN